VQDWWAAQGQQNQLSRQRGWCLQLERVRKQSHRLWVLGSATSVGAGDCTCTVTSASVGQSSRRQRLALETGQQVWEGVGSARVGLVAAPAGGVGKGVGSVAVGPVAGGGVAGEAAATATGRKKAEHNLLNRWIAVRFTGTKLLFRACTDSSSRGSLHTVTAVVLAALQLGTNSSTNTAAQRCFCSADSRPGD
jgi:hypothetical protein